MLIAVSYRSMYEVYYLTDILSLIVGFSLASNLFIFSLSSAMKAEANHNNSMNLEAYSRTLMIPCCSYMSSPSLAFWREIG